MSEVVTRRPLTDFFRDLIRVAARNQRVAISEGAEHYLVGLLEYFARPEPGWHERPLALDYLESMHAGDSVARAGMLRRVGDTALFLSGVFMDHLERQVVSSDYYISLGRSAYAHLARVPAAATARPSAVYTEMSDRFPELVNVLTDISFEQMFPSDHHTVRAYSRWLRTGNHRDARRLMRRGLLPVPPSRSGLCH
jgi:hypothetical protein